MKIRSDLETNKPGKLAPARLGLDSESRTARWPGDW